MYEWSGPEDLLRETRLWYSCKLLARELFRDSSRASLCLLQGRTLAVKFAHSFWWSSLFELLWLVVLQDREHKEEQRKTHPETPPRSPGGLWEIVSPIFQGNFAAEALQETHVQDCNHRGLNEPHPQNPSLTNSKQASDPFDEGPVTSLPRPKSVFAKCQFREMLCP